MIAVDRKLPGVKDIEWCIKVRSTDKTLAPITRVLVEKNRIVATDGKRLHCFFNAPVGLFEGDGLYTVRKAGKEIIFEKDTEGLTFPRWNQVYPRGKCVKKINVSVGYDGSDAAVAQIIRAMDPEDCVDIDFLRQIIDDGDWTVFFYGPKSPMLFKNCTRSAVLMPKRMG